MRDWQLGGGGAPNTYPRVDVPNDVPSLLCQYSHPCAKLLSLVLRVERQPPQHRALAVADHVSESFVHGEQRKQRSRSE